MCENDTTLQDHGCRSGSTYFVIGLTDPQRSSMHPDAMLFAPAYPGFLPSRERRRFEQLGYCALSQGHFGPFSRS